MNQLIQTVSSNPYIALLAALCVVAALDLVVQMCKAARHSSQARAWLTGREDAQ